MKKLRYTIAIDVDGVLRNLQSGVEQYGRSIGIPDLGEYDWKQTHPDLGRSVNGLIFDESNEQAQKQIWLDAPAYPIHESYMRIHEAADIIIATNQNRGRVQMTMEWLHRNSFPYDKMCVSSEKHLLPAHILIDDFQGTCENAIRNGKMALGIRSHRRHYPGKIAYPIFDDLNQATEYLIKKDYI